MNTLSQIGKQLGEIVGSMTPGARIMAALMIGVIVVSLGWILMQQKENEKTYILGMMSPAEIRKVEEAFGAALLNDYEIVNGTRIKVPGVSKATYMKALADGGAIPPQWGDKITDSLNSGIFDPPSLIAKRQSVAREQEFAQNLRRLSQVDFAAVAYDEKRKGFARETEKVCSIHVQQFGGRPIDMAVLKHIAESATTYFAGLKKEDVSVFDLGSTNIYRASGSSNSVEENLVLGAQIEWEDKYYRQLSSLLNQYGPVKLAVSVEIDNKLLEESERMQYDPTGVTLESAASRTDTETAKSPVGGRPGYPPNVANTPASVAANNPQQTSKTKESDESTRSEYGKTATHVKLAGLVPREVKISVGIPRSYFRKVHQHSWLLDNPDKTVTDLPAPTADELTKIEGDVLTEVKSAITVIPIGFRQGEDRQPYITVAAYTDLPLPEIPAPSVAENSMAWLAESWSTLAMVALVLISLGMMFNWIKTQPNDPETEKQFSQGFGLKLPEQVVDELDISGTGNAVAGGVNGNDGEEGGREGGPQFEMTGQDMKDDLSSLIKENPEAAANLLRTWIGDAA